MRRVFGLAPEQLRVVVITPQGNQDVIGIVTTLEGDPLPSGDIASRLGGYNDIAALEGRDEVSDSALIEELLGSKNNLHNNYQDYQAFLDNGGHIGLQHDPLLYGAYLLNPFLVQVELAPMLVVQQGEVAVIKAYVGLPTLDTQRRRVQVRLHRPARSPWASGAMRCAPVSTRSTRVCTPPNECRPRS